MIISGNLGNSRPWSATALLPHHPEPRRSTAYCFSPKGRLSIPLC
jgi:hypothetical protein